MHYSAFLFLNIGAFNIAIDIIPIRAPVKAPLISRTGRYNAILNSSNRIMATAV